MHPTDEHLLDLLLSRPRPRATSCPDDGPCSAAEYYDALDDAEYDASLDPDAGPSREERLVARYGEDVVYG